MPDPVAQSIAFLKRRIEQDQATLSQLEALPATRPDGQTNGSRPPRRARSTRRARTPRKAANAKAAALDDKQIMAAIRTAGRKGIGASAIRAQLKAKTDGPTMSRRLKALVDDGKLSKSGERRATVYKLNDRSRPRNGGSFAKNTSGSWTRRGHVGAGA